MDFYELQKKEDKNIKKKKDVYFWIEIALLILVSTVVGIMVAMLLSKNCGNTLFRVLPIALIVLVVFEAILHTVKGFVTANINYVKSSNGFIFVALLSFIETSKWMNWWMICLTLAIGVCLMIAQFYAFNSKY